MKRLGKLLIVSSLLLVTSGCSFLQPKVIEVPKYIEKPIPIVPKPRPVLLQDITWEVVSDKNLSEFLANNQDIYGKTIFIALDVVDYENLAINIAELKRYILQLLATVNYYEEMVKPAEPEASE